MGVIFKKEVEHLAKYKQKIVCLLDKFFSGQSMNYRQVIAIFIPILIDQAFIICLNLLNTAMVSSSGVAAVSAVNMVDSLNIFLVNVFIAVATGGTVVIAQYKGVQSDAMVSKSTAGAITSVATLAVTISILVIVFHTGTLNLLFGQAEAAVFHNARIYLIGSCISYPGIAVMEAVCGALRGIGKTKSSLTLSLILNLSYVFLNVVFINILHMGVLGMVISLNLARWFGLVCALVYLIKFNHSLNFHLKDVFHVDFSIIKRILYIGIPFAAEQMFFNGGKILTQTFIVQLGTLSMAVNAISGSLVNLLQISANALCLTVVTVVGQCMGRRDIKDARKFIRSFLGAASFFCAITAVVLLPLFPILIQLFSPPPEIIPEVFEIVLITAIVQPFVWPISFLTPAALRAAGDSKFTSIVSMLSMWLFRVVLGYLLGIVLHFGILGVWVAMDAEWGVRGIIFYTRYKGKKWCSHHVID